MVNGFGWEWKLLRSIQRRRTPMLDTAMPVISALGNNGLVWIAAALGLLYTRKHRKGGILLLTGLLCGVLVGNVFLKNLTRRFRPCWLNRSVSLLIPRPLDYSFPSCHTLSSVIAATILMLEAPVLGWLAVPVALLIAFSRIYLYVHFPTDVLASFPLGVAIGTAIWKWLRPLTDRWKAD